MTSAIVIGATGVTGQHILRQLLACTHYDHVIALSRRANEMNHPKLTQHVIDFATPDQWQSLVKGDDLFCALGTTLKQAGNRQAQYQVDFTFQANVIEAGANNAVKRLFLISSPGANAKSTMFYPRIKGELDEFALQQPFETRVLIKPSLITGERPDKRLGEIIGKAVLNSLSRWLPGFAKWRPISGEQLGSAIVNYAGALNSHGNHTLELDDIFNYLAK